MLPKFHGVLFVSTCMRSFLRTRADEGGSKNKKRKIGIHLTWPKLTLEQIITLISLKDLQSGGCFILLKLDDSLWREHRIRRLTSAFS